MIQREAFAPHYTGPATAKQLRTHSDTATSGLLSSGNRQLTKAHGSCMMFT
jgi:hypothetical protein